VNPEPQLINEGAGTFYLRGEVDFHTVTTLMDIDILDEADKVSIDLAGLQRVDSSAVALLVHWLRQAVQKNIPLRFLNIPELIKPLLALYDLDAIIQ